MKLKKIASLMLAGIMAVSMLAGCNGEPAPDPDNNGNGGNTATGYSATLGDKIEALSEKVKGMTYVDFKDDPTAEAALKSALGNLSFASSTIASVLPQVVTNIAKTGEEEELEGPFVNVGLMIDDFVDAMAIENDWLNEDGIADVFTRVNNSIDDEDTVTAGVLYVVDGTVEIDNALNQIAEKLDNYIENLPNANSDTNALVTYDYTVSTSIVNKPVSVIDWYSGSANFIAVTITRVSAQA